MEKHKLAVVAGLVTTLALTGAATLPAQAAKPQPISPATYSALGDSFAAGFGAGTPINSFAQSAQAYPVVLAGGLSKVNFRAVGFGGTTATVATYQIPLIPGSTQQVTLTVGGNDLGFVDKAMACFTYPAACALSDADRVKLGTLTQSLSGNIAAIHAAAPAATIYVTGYPLLFQAAQTPDNSGVCIVGDVTNLDSSHAALPISEMQADALDADAVALNRAIRSAIAGSANSYAKYVDVTAAFTGHGLCGTPSYASQAPNPNSYINPVLVTVTDTAVGPVPVVQVANGPLHPTEVGQQTYAASIRAKGFKG